jgi:transposase
LTTKIHIAVDGRGRPLAVVVTGGQRNDGAMLAAVLDEIVVPRIGGGQARSRPQALIADRAYSCGVTRRMLSGRKISTVIPQKRDEIGVAGAADEPAADHRLSTKPSTNSAISSNDHSSCSNNGARWPPAMTNSPSSTAPPSYSVHASPGPAIWETRSSYFDKTSACRKSLLIFAA